MSFPSAQEQLKKVTSKPEVASKLMEQRKLIETEMNNAVNNNKYCAYLYSKYEIDIVIKNELIALGYKIYSDYYSNGKWTLEIRWDSPKPVHENIPLKR